VFVCLQVMSAEQMDRACNNLKKTEKRLGVLQKQRAQAIQKLQSAEVGPRPALHCVMLQHSARCVGQLPESSVCSRSVETAQARGVAPAQLDIFQNSVPRRGQRHRSASCFAQPPPPPLLALQPRSLRCVCKRAVLPRYVHNDLCPWQVVKGQLDLHRQKIFSLKQARAAQKVRSTPSALPAPPPGIRFRTRPA